MLLPAIPNLTKRIDITSSKTTFRSEDHPAIHVGRDLGMSAIKSVGTPL